jgi:hypothetical protein
VNFLSEVVFILWFVEEGWLTPFLLDLLKEKIVRAGLYVLRMELNYVAHTLLLPMLKEIMAYRMIKCFIYFDIVCCLFSRITRFAACFTGFLGLQVGELCRNWPPIESC